MAIFVQVPKDLSGIKTKVALNLTKRQIICFSGAAVAGIPLYFLTKGLIGTSAASLLMMGSEMCIRDSGSNASILLFCNV